jgi:hypothetical protein
VARDASGNFVAGTITAALTGNASTATTLQTARTINGVSFNGAANITVADATKLPLAGGAMTGPITTTSTFDGRDVSVDGTKLDGIAAGATNVTNNNQITNGAGYTTYTANQAVDTSSSVTFSSVTAATINTTSDIRLKDNIRTFESAMDVVSQLRGVRFAWKETGVETVGLIAQEVEKVLPELIGTNADTGLKSVSYSNMVAVLIEAVKELKAEIEELKKR